MRDSSDGMIELLDASNQDNVFSSIIRHKISNEDLKLRFGIDNADYGRLKQILQFRPFENTGVGTYRYHFPLSYRHDPDDKDLTYANVRIEQLDKHKQFEFKISKKFMSNILWFNSLKDKKLIEAMIEK